MSSRENHSRVVEGLIKALSENISYIDLKSIYDENIELKREVADLQAVDAYNTKKTAQLMERVDGLSTQCEEKTAKLAAELEKKKSLSDKCAAVEQQLKDTKTQLNDAKDALQWLQGFSVHMMRGSGDA